MCRLEKKDGVVKSSPRRKLLTLEDDCERLERSLEEIFGGGGALSSWLFNKPRLMVIGATRREIRRFL